MRQALESALEALKNKMYAHAEMYLTEALAQPEQEPVAFICQGNVYMADDVDEYCTAKHIPLYTTPPQRKPLTDEQILDLNFDGEFCLITDDDEAILDFARLIEATHGIKE